MNKEFINAELELANRSLILLCKRMLQEEMNEEAFKVCVEEIVTHLTLAYNGRNAPHFTEVYNASPEKWDKLHSPVKTLS